MVMTCRRLVPRPHTDQLVIRPCFRWQTVTYVVFFTSAQYVFSTFNCESFDDGSLALKADYS
jgi:hypothetical protein